MGLFLWSFCDLNHNLFSLTDTFLWRLDLAIYYHSRLYDASGKYVILLFHNTLVVVHDRRYINPGTPSDYLTPLNHWKII